MGNMIGNTRISKIEAVIIIVAVTVFVFVTESYGNRPT